MSAPTVSMFGGVRIVVNAMARDVRTTFKVAPWPQKKRRRSWMVRRIEINRPGCYQMGDMLVMHPEIYAQLLARTDDTAPGERDAG